MSSEPNGWDEAMAESQRATAGKFIDLKKEKDTITCLIANPSPVRRARHWPKDGAPGGPVDCPGRNTCSRCKAGSDPEVSFVACVYVLQGETRALGTFDELGMKILDFKPKLITELRAAEERAKKNNKSIFAGDAKVTLTRTGEAKNTAFSVIFGGWPTADERKRFLAAPRLELRGHDDGSAPQQDDGPPPYDEGPPEYEREPGEEG